MHSNRLTLPRHLLLPAATFLIAATIATLLLLPGQAHGQTAPTFDDGTTTTRAVPENSAAGTNMGDPVAATDADMGDILEYSLEGTDASSFTIVSTSGQIQTGAALDYETKSSYSVTVKVEDDEDTKRSATIAVTINVEDVNEKPVIDTTSDAYDMDTMTASYNFAENGTDAVVTIDATDPDAAHSLTWTLTGDDASKFSIPKDANQDGELKFQDPPDFETPTDVADSDMMGAMDNIYKVTVNVTDGKDADGMDEDPAVVDATLELVITVTNVDEDGMVTITSTLEGGEKLTAAVTDPDGDITSGSLSWQWSSSTTSNGTFTDISGATDEEYTSVAADVGKFLKAKATYKDPQSTEVEKTAEAVTSDAITASNAEPEFPSTETGTRSVNENTAAEMNIGPPGRGHGRRLGCQPDLRLTGTDAASFDIDASSGQIKTKAALDHETKDSYSVNVTVRDSKDAAGETDTAVDATQAVTITVNDLNEPPDIDQSDPNTQDFMEIEFDIADGDLATTAKDVATYTATDPETDTLTWSVSGTDAASFTIDGNGQAVLLNSPRLREPRRRGGQRHGSRGQRLQNRGGGERRPRR